MKENPYVHGYSGREHERLHDQAATLTELLHGDTKYSAGATVLEAGCGVGAQTVILAKNSPGAHFVSVDISDESLGRARKLIAGRGITNVRFHREDIYNLTFEDESFDHVFVCFVLEHLPEPLDALLSVKRVLKRGGSITVIEGDHGSAFFYPQSDEARKSIECLIRLQAGIGGDGLIGRRLYPLLREAGFDDIAVSPRMVYADESRPLLGEGFTRNTFIAMVEGVREEALRSGLTNRTEWDKGIRDLNGTVGEGGVFCYTFFEGVAVKA